MKQTPLILVVDDDEDDQFLFEQVVKEVAYPCQLLFASHGLQALDLLDSVGSQPDFILTDLNMPRMDGMELLKTLKASPTWSGIPVIMLSTSSIEQTVQTAYQNGVSSFISKPTSLEELTMIWKQLYLLHLPQP